MSLMVMREKQIKKEGKRSKVPLIRIGVSDKPALTTVSLSQSGSCFSCETMLQNETGSLITIQ